MRAIAVHVHPGSLRGHASTPTLCRMNRIPKLWVTAYGSNRPSILRLVARQAVRAGAFIRALALADHHHFTVL